MKTLSEQLAGLANWLDEVADCHGDEEITLKATEVREWAKRLEGCVAVPVHISKGHTGRWCARINAGAARRYGDTATEAVTNLQAGLTGALHD